MEKINLQLSEKESRFKSYYEYLKKLADKLVEDPNSSETSDFITNEGEIHASILMGTLLSNTEENVRMYSSGLSPKLLCGETEDNYEEQTAYWKEFKAFFENINYFPKRTSDTQVDKPIKILVKKDIWKKNLPLQKVRQAMLAYPEKIAVKKENEESKKILSSYFMEKNQNIDFSVYDNTAFRLEYSPEEYKAIASFKNKKWSAALAGVFDKMFEVAEDLNF